MLCTVNDIITLMDFVAPPQFAEKDDTVGLIFGDRHAVVHNILVTLDVNDDVVEEAIDVNADLIISHHPLRLDGMSHINSDSYVGELFCKLGRHGIALFTAHTNLDSAPGGVNDTLCSLLELKDVKILEPVTIRPFKKLAVYVPIGYEDALCEAVCGAGAGNIGNYSECTFRVEGRGTFRPSLDTEPFIGERTELTEVPEVRIEAILPGDCVESALNAIRRIHPYEEPVIDIFDLYHPSITYGIGRVGDLIEPMQFNDFVNKVQDVLEPKAMKIAGQPDSLVKRIALVGGSGSGYFPLALNAGAQVFLSGEIKHHHVLEAQYYGLQLVDAGHYATERPIVPALIKILMDKCDELQYDVELFESGVDTDVFEILR